MTTQNAVGPTGSWENSAELQTVRTDPNGGFVLRNVPRAHVKLSVDHPDLLYVHSMEFRTEESFEDAQGNLRGVVLTAPLRLRFQVQLDDPDEADSFRIFDGDETELVCFAQTATNYNSSPSYLLLSEGRSKHLFVSDLAKTLVLYREGREVRRMALELTWLEETSLK